MAKLRGQAAVSAYFAAAPEKLTGILRGAARAGAKVIADEIKGSTPSGVVREAVRITTKSGDGRMVARIDLKPGWARAVGTWLEYGTSPHFISVDKSQRRGRSVSRINQQANGHDTSHSLVIGGKFVGATVFHPGARPHPTFRPALDTKEADAITAAQGYINARIARGGMTDGDDRGDDR